MVNVNLPFKRSFYSSNLNTTGKCQEWVRNEAELDTLIEWISFLFLLFLIVAFSSFSWPPCFHSDSY